MIEYQGSSVPPAWSSLCYLYAFCKNLKFITNGCLVYSCCSHLEHRPSAKSFVSLQFLNLRHSLGLLGRVVSLSQGRYLTDIHASSGIRTRDPSVQAGEDSSCLRPRGHCYRLYHQYDSVLGLNHEKLMHGLATKPRWCSIYRKPYHPACLRLN
jgi:hypothetical protein